MVSNSEDMFGSIVISIISFVLYRSWINDRKEIENKRLREEAEREKEQGLKDLLQRLQSSDNATTLMALDELGNERMTGGSLANANFPHANLKGAFLRGANLANANLGGANLAGAILRTANLANANLREATLAGAILRGANLTGANLDGANLTSANMRGANLTGANLREATLTGVFLKGANLTGTNLWHTNLQHANMANVECSATTMLPNGDKWTAEVDWSQFGAVELDLFKWDAYQREHELLRENSEWE